MHEQLEALWDARDEELPPVKGIFLSRAKSSLYNGQNDDTGGGSQLAVKWLVLVGHSLFHCKQREGAGYGGVFLTDVFSPVVARVGQRVLEAFQLPESEQPFALYLKGELVGTDILICPQNVEEKRLWLESIQQAAGKNLVSHSDKRARREKETVMNGNMDATHHQHITVTAPPSVGSKGLNSSVKKKNAWAQRWKRAAQKALSSPDASRIRKKFELLEKFFESETRYLNDLTMLVEIYQRQLKIAVVSGHILLRRDQLDAIFLNSDSLLMLHKVFCSQLKRVTRQPSNALGDLLHAFIPHMEIYAEFIRNHEKSAKVLEDCLQNSSLAGFLENHHSSHDCEAHQLKTLLHQPVTRLEIYQSFMEKVLEQTSKEHVDFKPLGQALQSLQDLKSVLVKASSKGENQDRILSIIETVGSRGFLLLEPDCKLILEDEMYLPATSKWVTGTIRRRPVHCYLYSNALVIISNDKKANKASSRSQVFPLSGATIYEHISQSGEVTHLKKDSADLEIRALKIYSPNGPRNGAVIIFLTQSSKNLWLARISERISLCTPDPIFPSSPSPPLNNGPAHQTTPPASPMQRGVKRRASAANTSEGEGTDTVSSSLTYSHTSLSRLDDGSMRRSPILISRTTSFTYHDTETKQLPETRLPSEYLSIGTLFSQLTSNPPDPHYPNTFLLTYRMFTNAHEVLDALLEGHRKELNARTVPSKLNVSISMESLRFFNVLKLWVNKYYVDFHHDVTLKKELVLYLNSVKDHEQVQEKEVELADVLLKTVSTRDHIPLIRRSKLRIQIPKAVEPIPEALSEISPDVLARQLTCIEHELYSRIKPYEFLQQKWTKKNRHELAPNICYVITRFNQMTAWITKVVLSPDHPKQRGAAISLVVQAACRALELNNFVTVFQITAALCSTAIQRLKKTWDVVPQNVVEQFEELKRLTSIDGSTKVYRKRQNSSPSPSVPYIGPYLSQLISVEVGMPTFVKNPPEHVNLSKLTKLAKVIDEIMRFQNPSYSIVPNGAIMIFIEGELESSGEFDEEKRYSRSLELEPRNTSGSGGSSSNNGGNKQSNKRHTSKSD